MIASEIDHSTIRPIGKKLLVKRYVKPETARGIIIPDAYRVDDTFSLYEYVRGSEKATEILGYVPEEGDIIVTAPWAAVMIDREYGFLEAEQVRKIITW